MLKTPDLVEYLKSSAHFFWSDVRIASIQIDASNIESFIEGIMNKMFHFFPENVVSTWHFAIDSPKSKNKHHLDNFFDLDPRT